MMGHLTKKVFETIIGKYRTFDANQDRMIASYRKRDKHKIKGKE